MSPASKGLYPLTISEIKIAVGDMVTADQPAVIAVTSDGRRIAIKCGFDGRVIVVTPSGTVMNSRQMIMVVEDFEEATPADTFTSPENADETARSEEADSGPSEPVDRPVDASPDDQVRRRRGASRPNAETAAPTATADTSPSRSDGAPEMGRRRVLVGGLAAAAVVGGVVGLKAFSTNNAEPTSVADTVASAEPAAPPSPRRPFPAPEDTDWMSAPTLETRAAGTYSDEGAKEFLGIDIDKNGNAILVGRTSYKGFVLSHRLGDGESGARVDVDTDPVFGFAAYSDIQHHNTLVGFTPKSPQEHSLLSTYDRNEGGTGKVEGVLEDARIIRYCRNRDFAVFLIEYIDGESSNSYGVAIFSLDSNHVGLVKLRSVDRNFNNYRSYTHVSIFQRDLNKWFIVLSGKNKNVVSNRSVGYKLSISLEKKSDGSPSTWLANDEYLSPYVMMPEGIGSPQDSQPAYFHATASAYAQDGLTNLIGGSIWNMIVQEVGNGFRQDVAISIQTADGNEYRRMFVRSDDRQDDGLVLADAVALSGGRFALLLREAKGEPLAIVAVIDSTGKTLARSWYSNSFPTVIAVAPNGELYSAGYDIRNGDRIASYAAYILPQR